MKTTPFTDIHIALGAKMHEFAGYNMPVEYTGIIDEHLTVCNSVGVFDVSHMGEIWLKGPNAEKLVQKLTSNDVASLPIGKVQYTCFTNNDGGIIDDLLLYHYESDKYMLVVNASNIEKDLKWIEKNNDLRVTVDNASQRLGLLAVQGPDALKTLQKLTKIDLNTIPYYSFAIAYFADIDDVIISNTGYTGAGGFEIYFYAEQGLKLWYAIMEAGKEFGIKPIGLGARDTLRLEMNFCLYGNDIDDTTTPLEAGLGWITKFVDGNDFTARDILEKQKAAGVERKLIGFKLIDKGIPRHGYEILDEGGSVIGHVTSGTMSPTLKQGIGMGYVKTDHSKIGSTIYIKVRDKSLKAEVAKAPFRKLDSL